MGEKKNIATFFKEIFIASYHSSSISYPIIYKIKLSILLAISISIFKFQIYQKGSFWLKFSV
jgi:hypothetical protein